MMIPIYQDDFYLFLMLACFLGSFLGMIAYTALTSTAEWLFSKFFAYWLGRNK